MGFKIEIKVEALEDINSAFQYYENAVEGLGEDFLSELDEYIMLIEDNPVLFE
ncbi:MAG: hypothetical protein ACJATI_005361 [Halioglobus sp.]|jgi:hypothetical protein